jgi:DNA-binding MarR family transcriptional regulator
MGLEIDRRQALDLWRQVLVTTVKADEPDLTARQIAVLMTVYLSPPPHTVRGLAHSLGVGKPAITRALDTLERLGLVRRRRDESDGRNVLIQRTVKGSAYLTSFGDLITVQASKLERSFTPEPRALD